MTTISSPSPTLKQLDQIATFFKQDKQKDALIKFESLPLYEQNRLYRTIWKEM